MRNGRSTRRRPLLAPHGRRALLAALAVATLTHLALPLAGCRVTADRPIADDRPLHRSLETIDRRVLQIAALPPQPHGAQFTGGATQSAGVYEIDHDADVELPDPAAYLAAVCREIQALLADRCTVQEALIAPDHCTFLVSSPYDATTGPDGVHHHRGMRGRVHLVAEPTENGRTRLHLTGVEWPG